MRRFVYKQEYVRPKRPGSPTVWSSGCGTLRGRPGPDGSALRPAEHASVGHAADRRRSERPSELDARALRRRDAGRGPGAPGPGEGPPRAEGAPPPNPPPPPTQGGPAAHPRRRPQARPPRGGGRRGGGAGRKRRRGGVRGGVWSVPDRQIATPRIALPMTASSSPRATMPVTTAGNASCMTSRLPAR